MYRQIARNKRWSILLIALFCVAVIGLGVFSAWVVGDVWPFWLLLIFCPLAVPSTPVVVAEPRHARCREHRRVGGRGRRAATPAA
ncbi:hypothetical protein [Microcella sp.]|uniref:hypothetical protein n=1 Tax=Microcella sp. TaxID=1913979 RepID=UPI003F708825